MITYAHHHYWHLPALAVLALALVLFVSPAGLLLLGAGLLLAMHFGVLRERAARRAADQRLSDREHPPPQVVERSVGAVVTVDQGGRTVALNAAAEQTFGWSSADLYGRSIVLLAMPVPAAAAAADRSSDRPATAEGPVGDGGRVIMVRRRDGSRFPAQVSCSHAASHPQGEVMYTVRDLTARHQSHANLQQANELLAGRVVQMEKQRLAIALLAQMSELLQAATTLAEAYDCVSDFGKRLFMSDAGALCVLDSEKNVVDVVATWGGEPRTRRTFAPDDCSALRELGHPSPNDPDAVVPCAHLSDATTVGQACIPLVSRGTALGIVHFRWEPTDSPTDSAGAAAHRFRERVAVAFTDQVGLAIVNLRRSEFLRVQATCDALTGLHNRRFLEEAFQRELFRAARKWSPVGILMLDLDHFKAFNDAHGHAAGDALLQRFARELRSKIRAEDVACRYGGDEFAVILPDATLPMAQLRAEQIAAGVRNTVVDFHDRTLSGLRVSIGIAGSPDHGTSPDQLLRAADAALYAAKAAGGDRVALATQVLVAAESHPSLSALSRDWLRATLD